MGHSQSGASSDHFCRSIAILENIRLAEKSIEHQFILFRNHSNSVENIDFRISRGLILNHLKDFKKSGHFIIGEVRTFLLCLDIRCGAKC